MTEDMSQQNPRNACCIYVKTFIESFDIVPVMKFQYGHIRAEFEMVSNRTQHALNLYLSKAR